MKNPRPQLYDCIFFPIPSEVADDEADGAEYPVDDHGYPHTEHAHAEIFSKDVAECDPEDPHGCDRDDHAGLGIAGSPECSWKCECERPYEDGADSVEMYDLSGCFCCQI